MASGYEYGGRYSQDPIGSQKSRGKSRSQRKHRNDGPSWTPTEQHRRNELMRQFMRNPEGSGGASATFRERYDLIDWSK